ECLVQGVCLGIGVLTPQRPASSFHWEGEEISPSRGETRRLPNVLLVGPLSPPPPRGGGERGAGLVRRGRLARRPAMRLFNTFRLHDPSRSLLQRLIFQVRMILAFRHSLKENVNLVHIKTSSGINFFQNSLYALVARLSGLPVLLQIHSGRFETFYLGSSAPLRAWIR